MPRIAPTLLALSMLAPGITQSLASDLTIEIGGDLLKLGGVVTVYPIPVAADVLANDNTRTIRVDDRYAEVQLRYVEGGEYTYRFQPAGERAADSNAAPNAGTQVLSVIGTDPQNRGPQMTSGFKDSFSSGGNIIRVLSLAESAGDSAAARWGETEGKDALPPADERSARVLASILGDGPDQPPLQCVGGERVQTCTLPADRWPALDARWWRGIAEMRLERLRHFALDRCYNSTWLGGGMCDEDPTSNEPAYTHRSN